MFFIMTARARHYHGRRIVPREDRMCGSGRRTGRPSAAEHRDVRERSTDRTSKCRGAQGCAGAVDGQDVQVPRSTGMCGSGRRTGRPSAAEHRDVRERPSLPVHQSRAGAGILVWWSVQEPKPQPNGLRVVQATAFKHFSITEHEMQSGSMYVRLLTVVVKSVHKDARADTEFFPALPCRCSWLGHDGRSNQARGYRLPNGCLATVGAGLSPKHPNSRGPQVIPPLCHEQQDHDPPQPAQGLHEQSRCRRREYSRAAGFLS
jgi:hypothetical protein